VAPEEVIEGLPVSHPRYLMIPKIATGWHGPMMARSLRPFFERLRERFDFDLIDTHYVYPDGYAAVEIGAALGKPVVVTALGSDINVLREMPSVRPHLDRTLSGAAALIGVSAALVRSMRELGAAPEKLHAIPNGVDARKFHPVARDEARARTGTGPGRLLLSVGHLTENKGFHRLIGALPALRKLGGYEDVTVAIVGEGVFRTELERLIASSGLGDRVRLAGEVSHAELHLWYASADLSCIFSTMEGWPNVVLESLACGTPVLGTPVGGIPEILGNHGVGALVQGDDEALASGIAAALDRSWDRAAIARFAEARSWDRAGESLHALFSSILTRERVPA
jgi:glycosyltransferase involved in cell wall biosynthesis